MLVILIASVEALIFHNDCLVHPQALVNNVHFRKKTLSFLQDFFPPHFLDIFVSPLRQQVLGRHPCRVEIQNSAFVAKEAEFWGKIIP